VGARREAIVMPSNRRKRDARKRQALTGMSYTRALRDVTERGLDPLALAWPPVLAPAEGCLAEHLLVLAAAAAAAAAALDAEGPCTVPFAGSTPELLLTDDETVAEAFELLAEAAAAHDMPAPVTVGFDFVDVHLEPHQAEDLFWAHQERLPSLGAGMPDVADHPSFPAVDLAIGAQIVLELAVEKHPLLLTDADVHPFVDDSPRPYRPDMIAWLCAIHALTASGAYQLVPVDDFPETLWVLRRTFDDRRTALPEWRRLALDLFGHTHTEWWTPEAAAAAHNHKSGQQPDLHALIDLDRTDLHAAAHKAVRLTSGDGLLESFAYEPGDTWEHMQAVVAGAWLLDHTPADAKHIAELPPAAYRVLQATVAAALEDYAEDSWVEPDLLADDADLTVQLSAYDDLFG
jgi:hypothetical protein